jgi:DNA (cytosine-5)-methyltransferase 1
MKYSLKHETNGQWLIREENRVYQSRIDGELGRKRKRFRLIDTFSGAGGMTLGFSKKYGHAFDPVWANDFNACCVRTYNANFGNHCLDGDIVDILNDPATKIPQADVVIGGPPCQGYSLLNKNREGDPRKQLWRLYFEIVERSGARMFVMENVPQLLNSFEHGEIMGTAEAMGFKVWGDVLCAADFGVPQTRRRAFIVGCKFFNPAHVFPPRKTNFSPSKNGVQAAFFEGNGYLPNAEKWRTVRDAISDLPSPVGTEIRDEAPPLDLHFGRTPTPMSLARYKAIPEEGMNRFDLQRIVPDLTPGCWVRKVSGGTDLFGRLWWDRPAFTIRTEFFKPEKGRYLHLKGHKPITASKTKRSQLLQDNSLGAGRN